MRQALSQAMTFGELHVGDTFDFVGPDPMLNSFHSRCTKVSSRCYVWEGGTATGLPRELKARVGSVKVKVYHVEGMAREREVR